MRWKEIKTLVLGAILAKPQLKVSEKISKLSSLNIFELNVATTYFLENYPLKNNLSMQFRHIYNLGQAKNNSILKAINKLY